MVSCQGRPLTILFLIRGKLDFYQRNCKRNLFSLAVSLRKCLAHFLLPEAMDKTSGNKHFWSQKNEVIFHICYQIRVSRALPSLPGGLHKIMLTVPLN